MNVASRTAAVIAVAFAGITPAQDSSDLESMETWSQPARGVWRAELGDLSRELRYTELAAGAPRIEALEALPDVSFPFATPELAIRYRVNSDGKVLVRVPTTDDERIYGFGLQLDGIRKSRKILTLNVDHWAKGGGRTHAPVPFYISSRGYGVFFNTARFLKVYCQVGNRKDSPNLPPRVDRNPPDGRAPTRPVARSAAGRRRRSDGERAWPRDHRVLRRVAPRRRLAVQPLLWRRGAAAALGARVSGTESTPASAPSRPSRKWQRSNATTCHSTSSDSSRAGRRKSYPCTFEWQRKRFPDPQAFVGGLLERGVRVNLWVNPYISPESRIYEAMEPLSGSHLVWLGIVPDYTLPEARRILTDQHRRDHLSMGVSGYKIDEVDGYDRWLWPDHATFPSGTPAETMRQSYGLIMQRMIQRELFESANRRTYGLVRASNGAASGYPFAIYSDSYRHREYLAGISAASLSGLLWTPEIRSAKSGREWLNRMQTVCFSHFAMLNAWASGTKPWSFEDVIDPVREAIELRMRLLPYLYTAFAEYERRGVPPIRAMLLDERAASPLAPSVAPTVTGTIDGETSPYGDGEHREVLEADDQFFFGPSILVAPFYENQAVRRSVRLPPGDWYDFYSGELAGNGVTITVTAEQTGDRIPLFVRDGAVIPMLTKGIHRSDRAFGHALELRHYGTQPGRCELYEDDGATFEYRRGRFRVREFAVTRDDAGTFRWSSRIARDGCPRCSERWNRFDP